MYTLDCLNSLFVHQISWCMVANVGRNKKHCAVQKVNRNITTR